MKPNDKKNCNRNGGISMKLTYGALLSYKKNILSTIIIIDEKFRRCFIVNMHTAHILPFYFYSIFSCYSNRIVYQTSVSSSKNFTKISRNKVTKSTVDRYIYFSVFFLLNLISIRPIN